MNFTWYGQNTQTLSANMFFLSVKKSLGYNVFGLVSNTSPISNQWSVIRGTQCFKRERERAVYFPTVKILAQRPTDICAGDVLVQ